MRSIFHKISYLQYPLILAAVYYIALFVIALEDGRELHYVNTALVFCGIAISLSTLQDTTTTQNEISRKIWEHPVKGKIFLALIGVYAFAFMAFGLVGFVRSTGGMIEDISLGLVVLGIGMVGMLKSAAEMFENHRLDKRTDSQ